MEKVTRQDLEADFDRFTTKVVKQTLSDLETDYQSEFQDEGLTPEDIQVIEENYQQRLKYIGSRLFKNWESQIKEVQTHFELWRNATKRLRKAPQTTCWEKTPNGICGEVVTSETEEPQAGVTVTYIVCPVHGRINGDASVDD